MSQLRVPPVDWSVDNRDLLATTTSLTSFSVYVLQLNGRQISTHEAENNLPYLVIKTKRQDATTPSKPFRSCFPLECLTT